MSRWSVQKKISEMQIYPVAFNSSRSSPTSWASLKTELDDSGPNVDYLVIHKPKSKTTFNQVASYLGLHALPWNIALIVSIFLNYFLTSYTFLLVRPKSEFVWPLYLILTCDMMYISDVLFSAIKFFNKTVRKRIVESPRCVALTTFDLFLSLPCSFVYMGHDSNTESATFLALRFITVLRLYRVMLFYAKIEGRVCSHRWPIFALKYFSYLVLLQHGTACLWYLLANPITKVGGANWSTVMANDSYRPGNFLQWYFVCTYFAVTEIYSCGFGNIWATTNFERMTAVLEMSLGTLLTTMYVSALIVLFLRAKHAKHKLQHQLSLILKHLKFVKADKDVVKGARDFFDAFWIRKLGVRDTDTLQYLTDDMSIQMNYNVNCSMLRYSVVFTNKPEVFLKRISALMKHEFYSPGESIYTENEIKHKMVIIKSGTVDVLSEEDHETGIVSFGPGTCLGEASIVLCLPAKVTLKASTYVDAQVLHMKDFYRISPNYPELFADIRAAIFKRIYRVIVNERKSSNTMRDLKQLLIVNSSKTVDSQLYTQLLTLYNYKDSKSRHKMTWFATISFPWILQEDSVPMLIWEVFIALCALTVAIFHPYYIVYERRLPQWYDIITDVIQVIFVVDVYVLLTTGMIRRGIALDSLKKILDERLDTVGFYLDVFSAFYNEVYAYLADDVDRYYFLLKTNRLLKVYRISTLCARLENSLKPHSIVICWAKYAIYIPLFAYWYSVLLYWQTCYYSSCIYDGWFISEIVQDLHSRILSASVEGKLLISLYFGYSSAFAVGIGDIVPGNFQDMCFVMIGLLIGKLIYGYCVAEYTSILALQLKPYHEFREREHKLNNCVKDTLVPGKLKRRIVNYFQVQWTLNEVQSIFSGDPLLHNLSPAIRREILMQERMEFMRKIRLVADLDETFLTHIVLHSSTVVLPPNEIVTYFGSISREMYVIYKGYCLQQTENNVYKTLSPGRAIGFASLLFGLPSLNNIFTMTHCVMVCVDVNVFNDALSQSPGLYAHFYKTRQLILTKYQANFEVKMIENPHYTRKKKAKRAKYRRTMRKTDPNTKSFVNAYRYCVHNGESYSKLSNRTSRMCFLKYLLMPICILPYGLFIRCWAAFRLLVTGVVVFGMPVNYIFAPYINELHYAFFALDLLAYIDMYLMLHVGYYGKSNELVIHPWKTAEHYLKGAFVVDVIIWFPIALFFHIFDTGHSEGHSELAHKRSPHVFHCWVLLFRIFDAYRFECAFHHLQKKMTCVQLLQVVKYLFYAIVIIHGWTSYIMTTTCQYIHLEELDHPDIENNMTKIPGMIPRPVDEVMLYCRENSWLNRSQYHDYSGILEVYLTAFYWTTSTIAGVGFGDLSAQNRKEVIITLLIILNGVFYFGYVLTRIISQAIKIQTTRLNYEEKMVRLINFMKREKLEKEFRHQVKTYVQHKWKRTKGQKLHVLLSKMHSTLREDTILHLYEETLRHVPVFENLDHSFFRVFGKELSEQYYMQGQIVIKANDIVQDIFIVHKGTVEILSHHNVIPVTMGIGGVFGNVFEEDLSLCGITVRALKDLDVLCLNIETFRRMLKNYPFIQKKIGLRIKNEAHRYYSVPKSFVDDQDIFINKNRYWMNRQSISMSSKKSILSICKSTFSPNSYLYSVFSSFTLFTAYFNGILTTYQFSFQHFSTTLLIMLIVIDVVFLVKFCMEINTPYYNNYGQRFHRPLSERCWYRRWSRTLDFLANLPFSYTLLFVPIMSDKNANFYFSLWRLITLLRLYYVAQYFCSYKNKLVEKRFFLEVSTFFICSTLICHTFACIWYIIVCPFKTCEGFSWATRANAKMPLEMYVASMYLVVNIFSGTGTGDILPETALQTIYVIVSMIGSKILLGYFIAQFVAILQSGNLCLWKYEGSMCELKNYFLNMGVKKSKWKYAKEYLCLLWRTRQGLQIPDLIEDLPLTLKIEIMTAVYGSLLRDSYIFCQTEKDFIRQLTPLLRHRIFFPGNYIVRDGDADTSMYFIHRGDVEILTVKKNQSETVHEVLHESEVFGIVQGLFREIPHHFSFRALTFVDLVILKLNDWEYLLDFFPASKESIYQRVEEIYYTI